MRKLIFLGFHHLCHSIKTNNQIQIKASKWTNKKLLTSCFTSQLVQVCLLPSDCWHIHDLADTHAISSFWFLFLLNVVTPCSFLTCHIMLLFVLVSSSAYLWIADYSLLPCLSWYPNFLYVTSPSCFLNVVFCPSFE